MWIELRDVSRATPRRNRTAPSQFLTGLLDGVTCFFTLALDVFERYLVTLSITPPALARRLATIIMLVLIVFSDCTYYCYSRRCRHPRKPPSPNNLESSQTPSCRQQIVISSAIRIAVNLLAPNISRIPFPARQARLYHLRVEIDPVSTPDSFQEFTHSAYRTTSG